MIKKIKVYNKSRNMDLGTVDNFGLGIEKDNGIDTLFFEFDEMIDGQATLLTDIVGNDGIVAPFSLTKVENGYQLQIINSMLLQREVTIQLRVTNGTKIWNSKVYTTNVFESLDTGDGEMPSGVTQWLTQADNKLLQISAKETEIISNENTRKANENTRISNETTRQTQETSRETYINELKEDVEEGKLNGKSLEFNWDGTKLGIRVQGQTQYSYTDLKGTQGPIGPQGEAFTIYKRYDTVSQMNQDFDNVPLNKYVMIQSTVEQEDNAKMYQRGETQWIFICDFSGATGIRGPKGDTPSFSIGTVNTVEYSQGANATITGTDLNPVLNLNIPRGQKGDTGNTGATGSTGATGNGISNITKTSTSGLVDTYTINYTNGSKSNFQVTNGEDGDVLQQEEINKLKSIIPKSTTTNAKELSYKNAQKFELLDWKYNGNVYQLTTEGYNLIPFPYENGKTISNGLTFEPLSDGGVKVTGTSTAQTNFDIVKGSSSNASKYKPQITESNGTISVNGLKDGMKIITSGSGQNGFPYKELTPTATYYTGSVTDTTKYLNYITIRVESGKTIDTVIYVNLVNGSTVKNYEPYTGLKASPNPDYPQEVVALKGWNLIGLDTQQYKVDLKAGDKITACNTGTNQLTLQLFSEYGDTTRNDYWTINSGITRTITVGYDTKALSWNVSPVGGTAYINKGDNLKPYLPYNSIGVKRIGNILDNEFQVGTILSSNGNNASSTTRIRSKNYSEVKPSTLYRIESKGNIKKVMIYEYANDKSYIKSTGWVSANYDITTQATTKYIRLVFENSDATMSTSDLEYSYVYDLNESSIDYINLNGNEVLTDNYVYLKNGKAYLHKAWGKVVLDGSLSWSKTGTNVDRYYYKNEDLNTSQYNQIKCTHFTWNDTAETVGICTSNYQGFVGFAFSNKGESTLDDFITWLSINKPILYYKLATPQEIELGTKTIESINGSNNVTVLATLDSSSLSETYAVDVQSEIEELQNAILVLGS